MHGFFFVSYTGFEPVTSALSRQRSEPTELIALECKDSMNPCNLYFGVLRFFMRHVLALLRVILLVSLLLKTSIIVVVFRFFGRQMAHNAMRVGMNLIAHVLGVRSTSEGSVRKERQLVLMNHPSYLDILFLHKLSHPTTLLAADNFKFWPFIGWLGTAVDVIWVKRHHKASGKKVRKAVEHRLNKGLSIIAFPEGRTSGTHDIYPIKPGLFFLAQEQQIPITFACVRYENQHIPYFHSLKSGFGKHFLRHFWGLMGQFRIPSKLCFSEPHLYDSPEEGMQAFYAFHAKHLQDICHFPIPVQEEFIGEALSRIDPEVVSFRPETQEELLA